LPSFTEDGKYRYLRPLLDLPVPILREGEMKGFLGTCEVCGAPRFDSFWGPLRFSRRSVADLDGFSCSGLSTVVYGRRLWNLLRTFEPDAELFRPVVYE
jgi:hypothetical protein